MPERGFLGEDIPDKRSPFQSYTLADHYTFVGLFVSKFAMEKRT